MDKAQKRSTSEYLQAARWLPYFSTLKMEAVSSYETPVTSHRATRHNILHSHGREEPKTRLAIAVCFSRCQHSAQLSEWEGNAGTWPPHVHLHGGSRETKTCQSAACLCHLRETRPDVCSAGTERSGGSSLCRASSPSLLSYKQQTVTRLVDRASKSSSTQKLSP
jgi:hypothetical protein